MYGVPSTGEGRSLAAVPPALKKACKKLALKVWRAADSARGHSQQTGDKSPKSR